MTCNKITQPTINCFKDSFKILIIHWYSLSRVNLFSRATHDNDMLSRHDPFICCSSYYSLGRQAASSPSAGSRYDIHWTKWKITSRIMREPASEQTRELFRLIACVIETRAYQSKSTTCVEAECRTVMRDGQWILRPGSLN